ncbi:hypothetical protein GGE65_008348 [Skermanella aerolata]
MRMTVLGQYAKGLAHHNALEATALQDRLERIKWRLWHGDPDEAQNRACELAEDVAALDNGYPGLARLVEATAGLATYIDNNCKCRVNTGTSAFPVQRVISADKPELVMASRSFEDAMAQQVKSGTAVHGALDRLQAADLPFHRAGTPRQR